MIPTRLPPPPRPAAAAAVLAAALRGRRAVELRYGGAWRRVHPHALGRSARGRLSLLAWQVADARDAGRHPGWRMFDLAKLEALEPLPERFAPRPLARSPILRPLGAA